MSRHQATVSQLKTKFKDIGRAYDVHSNIQSSRTKRDFDSSMEQIPIIGHLYGILKSPWETKKIKKHLNQLQERFVQFTEATTDFVQEVRNFQKEVLTLMTNSMGDTRKLLKGMNCDIDALSSVIIYQNILMESLEKTRTILSALDRGRLEAEVGQILDMKDIELLVKSSRQLNSTMFKLYPELLFRVGQMVLTDITESEKSYNFHFVLVAPNLRVDGIHQMYNAIQVPINEPEDPETCMGVQLPTPIFKANGKFFTADITDCQQHNALLVCLQNFDNPFSASFQELSCLNGNFPQCTTILTPCSPTIKFTKAGALIFSNEKVLGMPIGRSTTLDIISVEGRSTYFAPWEAYSLAQTGQKLISSLEYAEDAITLSLWEEPSKIKLLYESIRARARILQRQNLTTLRKIVDNTNDIIFEDLQPNFLNLGVSVTKKKFLEYFAYLSMAVSIISIIIMVAFRCCKRQKNTTRLLEVLANSIINPERAARRAPRLRVYEQDIEDEERGLPTVSAAQLPLRNAFRLNARSDMAENPIYESTPTDSASLRRAYSYGGRPYPQLDIQAPLNRKRHATTESEDLYQHLAKRRSVSTPQLPISTEEEEPVNAQAYTQTTLKQESKRQPKLAKNLDDISKQHLKAS